jgi:hypothetical protein
MLIFLSPSGLEGETIHGRWRVDGVFAAMQQVVVSWFVPARSWSLRRLLALSWTHNHACFSGVGRKKNKKLIFLNPLLIRWRIRK